VKAARPVRESDIGETTHGNLGTAPRVDSHWSEGGETNLDNLTLLCRRHHDLVHHSDWQIQMVGGLPVFRPPAFIDSHRRPRTNLLHTA